MAALPELGRPAKFENDVTTARTGLLGKDSKPYEEGLVYLGRLIGAHPSEGDGGATAAPDATWIFATHLWICWEGKSEADPETELGADDVRQAGGHLRYVADRRREPIPGASLSVLMTRQKRMHPTARAVAEPHVFLVNNGQPIELFDRLVRVWRRLRAQGGDVGEDVVVEALRAEQALPSQWLPVLTAERLART